MDVPDLGNRGVDVSLLLLIAGALLGASYLQGRLEANREKEALDRAAGFAPGESA